MSTPASSVGNTSRVRRRLVCREGIEGEGRGEERGEGRGGEERWGQGGRAGREGGREGRRGEVGRSCNISAYSLF